MVHLDSNRISRVPFYSGNPLELANMSSTGLLPSMVGISMPFLYVDIYLVIEAPTTPHTEMYGLGCSAFARRY